MPFLIDDELRLFLESGVATVVGTADEAGRPHVCFGWGTRVIQDGTRLEVCVEPSRGAAVLRDAAATGAIAVTYASPTTYRSVQLKGRATSIVPGTTEDHARVQQQRDAFLSATSLVGDIPAIVKGHWAGEADLQRIEIEVARAFDQTPGPMAGRAL